MKNLTAPDSDSDDEEFEEELDDEELDEDVEDESESDVRFNGSLGT